ncbi:MAG: FAD-dependent oxidoreductase [Roseiflexaceae bacterium]
MQRRRFVGCIGAFMLAAPSLAPSTQATAAEVSAVTPQVLVIGAGLAGLAAARELQARGVDVVVLEGRKRIGGRIWTSTKWPDLPLDLGASWIHGVQGNPLTTLANTIKAPRVITSYDNSQTYNTAGKPLSDAEMARLDRLHEQVQQLIEAAQQAEQDRSVRQAMAPLIANGSPETLRYLDFILNGTIEHEYAGRADQLSVYWYDSAKAFPGDDAIFRQGFHVISEYLAKGLRIELGQIVRRIDWSASPVRVVTNQREYRADHVLITLPLGVLQAGQIQYTPALPSAKQRAIAALGMGVLNKCYLRFAEPFWPDDVDWLEYIPSKYGEWTEWVSFLRTANMPVLLGFNAAEQGRAIEALSDRQIVASALQTLRIMYGQKIPNPIDYQITRWASDPFALGTYSFNPVGSHPRMRQELAKPVAQQLFFAGEATEHEYFATAHGAYRSGLRAAQEILR